MRFVILTLGTRGDVQPYLLLGEALQQAGHQVTLCTGISFKALIEARGLTYAYAHLDFPTLLADPEAQAIFEQRGKAPLATMRYTKKVIKPLYQHTMTDFWHASAQAECIIYHPKALGAIEIAQKRNIPCISMPPIPMTIPLPQFPNLAIAPTRNLGALLNKLSYKVNDLANLLFAKELKHFRQEVLQLQPKDFDKHATPTATIYPISKHLFPDVTTWPNQLLVSGFFLDTHPKETLASDLKDFLAQGKKPILLTFSSMRIDNIPAFIDTLYQAIQHTGDRLIILSGENDLPLHHKDILVTKQAPHLLLMPHTKGVIHHGGVGTTAAALASGVPQQIIPFSVDQPFWAHRLWKQGYALKPIKIKRLNPANLSSAFHQMNNPDLLALLATIAQKIRQEDGLANAVAYLQRIIT